MTDAPARHLLFHGTVVLTAGLLCGLPFGRAITRGRPADVVRAWRVAHSVLCLGGALLLAVAAVLAAPLGPTTPAGRWLIAGPLIASGYGFAYALPFGAWAGARGLAPGGGLANQIVYSGNLVGAVGSLAGTAALLYAAGRQL